ncbi:SURF1 family protein [Achromobacter aloeverae]|uniref:SURF1-like protein n=1 Tax=Achromobacter aloeverae TaxID=1750518 RepID=A0A4Q1HL34_9BURK|nr:SURF1 family protein [Achromobacter aloeverae]RXN90198.1 SURF1 family protein [Achromobacter aloeverae]
MVRPHSTARTLAALLLLAAAVVVLVSLGRWQLRRADERRAILAAIERGRSQPPLMLAADTPPTDLQPWRPAQANGHYRDDLTVVLDNRNREGRPGYWIATPLLLEGSTPATAVLVLRGWMARAQPGQPPAVAPPAPPGIQHVTGELAERVPRLFELWHFGGAAMDALPQRLPAADGKPPTVQNLDLAEYGRASGFRLLPVVLEQSDADEDVLKHDWPQPSVDFNQNQGYALQWFGFASIAGIAFLVVAWRAWRRRSGGDPGNR